MWRAKCGNDKTEAVVYGTRRKINKYKKVPGSGRGEKEEDVMEGRREGKRKDLWRYGREE